MSIAEALAIHYTSHGLPPDGGAQSSWFHVRIGRVLLPLPNPPARRRAVLFHDVNHLLTGYNTVFSDGEMVIAGFELGSGCGRFLIAWLINAGMFSLGLVVCARPMFGAFVRGRRTRSIYDWPDSVSLRRMTVSQVKAALQLPTGVPVVRLGDRVLFGLWALAAVSVVLGFMIAIVVGLQLLSNSGDVCC